MPKNTIEDKSEEGRERKKKNAQAQAAFRQRRANYISTLEETVTRLESVVLQLQESCRAARSEASDLHRENNRVRNYFCQREKLWRGFLQSRKTEHGTDEELPSLPSPFSPASDALPAHASSYTDNGYRTEDGQYSQSHTYSGHTSSMSYGGTDSENTSGDCAARIPKFNSQYQYMTSNRDVQWLHPLAHSSSSGPDSSGGAPTSNSSHESPTMASDEMNYGPRFDRKLASNELDTAPYVFPMGTRSISPGPVASPTFAFPDNPVTSDVHLNNNEMSLAVSDPARYNRQIVDPASESDDEGHSHRAAGGPMPHSRSHSPDTPVLSGTLAVIKAQAFGALRRTRQRPKRPSDGSARVAMNVLDSRGISTHSSGSKRPRLHQDLT